MKKKMPAAIAAMLIITLLVSCQGKEKAQDQDLGDINIQENENTEYKKAAKISLLDDKEFYIWEYTINDDSVVEISDEGQTTSAKGNPMHVYTIIGLKSGNARVEFDYNRRTGKGSVITDRRSYAIVTVDENLSVTCELRDTPVEAQNSTFYFETPEETEAIANTNTLRYQANGYVEGQFMYDLGLQSVTYFSVGGSYILYTSTTPIYGDDPDMDFETVEIAGTDVKKGSDGDYYIAEWKEGSAYYCIAYIGSKKKVFEELLVGAYEASVGLNDEEKGTLNIIEGQKEN